MPAGQGKDAERFAVAVEQGTPPGFAGDDDLARELEIVAMLRSRGAAFAPDPDAKARAKQRLMAVLAAEQVNGHGGGRRSPVAPPSAEERTAPLARVLEPAFPPAPQDTNASSATEKMPAYTRRSEPVGETEADAATTDAATTTAARPGRRHSSRHSSSSRPAGRARGSSRPARRGLPRRAVLVGSAALVMLLALAGGGIFASRNALPGDQLYALKRVAEAAGLAFTFDDAGKAQRHLQIASTRLDEVERLVARDPQAPAAPGVLTSAIQEFDAATGEGSRILLATHDTDGAAALGDLRTWAGEQADRLTSLRPELPVPAAADADSAIQLLDRLRGRTEALTARSSCTEVTSGRADDLGPLPAVGTCAPRPVLPKAPGAGSTDENEQSSTQHSPDSTPQGTTEDPSSSAAVPETSSTDKVPGLPGLLPDLGGTDSTAPDGRSGDGSEEDSTTPTTTKKSSVGDAPAPAPLIPPITLPPLLPGMPGITIG
ncbi:DUF5667 domain-containing protein [Pseudonocardia sp.]|uniref:DUF5667 domain-containing protein n=1 Tax=Pseudonocardia sp. TaxID=60912 RepID=UPI0031FBDF29